MSAGLDWGAVLGGWAAGLVSGVLPGLHPNTVASLLIQGGLDARVAPALVVSMLGLRAAVQFIPAIFMGIPSEETALAPLPGQRMFLEGRANQAVVAAALAVAASTLAGLALAPLALAHLPALMEAARPFTLPVLAGATALMLLEERGWGGRARGAAVFLLAAILGGAALGGPLPDPFFPLFVGFFTLPALLRPAGHGRAVSQRSEPLEVDAGWLAPLSLGTLLGAGADLFPGLSSPAQVALVATLLLPRLDAPRYLALVASIETSHTLLALASASSAGVARVGALAMVQEMAPLRLSQAPLWLALFATSAMLGCACAVGLGRWLGARVSSIPWSAAERLLLAYLVLAVGLQQGALGLLVLFTASAVGVLASAWGVRRTQVMGCLIAPALMGALARAAA